MNETQASLISLREIKKAYQMGKVPVHALRGVDLCIEDGEIDLAPENESR